MGAFLGLGFLAFFSLVNLFLWGDHGYIVHLLSVPVPSYGLVWLWIALIAVIYGANYAPDGESKHRICHVIGFWWTVNIGMTTLLNFVNYRGIEEAGETVFGMPGLVLDFMAQGAVDLASLAVLWILIKRLPLGVSVWMLIFCGYLVANLFGHASGAYQLMIGADPGLTAESYDSYMYLVFTLMLLLQAVGSSGDAALRWWGSNVDLYIDIRPFFRRLIGRDLHLF